MVIDLNLVCTESFRVYLAYVYVYCTVQTVYLYRMFSRGRSEPWSERPSADLPRLYLRYSASKFAQNLQE